MRSGKTNIINISLALCDFRYIFSIANTAVRVPFDIDPSGRGVDGIVTWLWLQETGINGAEQI